MTEKEAYIAVALEYENATLDAIKVLANGTTDEQVTACIRWGESVTAFEKQSNEDYNRGGQLLIQRGNLNPKMHEAITMALKHFVSAGKSGTRR